MKKILVTAAAMLVALGTYAQGTLNFSNFAPPIDAPVFDVGGTAKLATGFAQLYAGAVGGSLTAVGSPVALGTGEAAGYFFGGTVTVPGIAGDANANARVRAWRGAATYEAATIRGESSLLTVSLGGGGTPPGPPKDLTGLTSFSLVPEPSTIALGVLGGLALLIRRRK